MARRSSAAFGSTHGHELSSLVHHPVRKHLIRHMDAVSTNRGKMYLSGQHCLFGWDTMTVAEQMIAEKLGMDVIDVAYQESPWARGAKRLLPGAQL